METTIMGYIGIIGYILGLCRDNGRAWIWVALKRADACILFQLSSWIWV